MGLVLTRNVRSGVRVHTPKGDVEIFIKQIKGKQVRLAVNCDRSFKINRLDYHGKVEKNFTNWTSHDTNPDMEKQHTVNLQDIADLLAGREVNVGDTTLKIDEVEMHLEVPRNNSGDFKMQRLAEIIQDKL